MLVHQSYLVFNRAFLAAFFTFVASFYLIRILYRKKALNAEQIFTGNTYSTTWWNHLAFKSFRAAILLVCVIRFFYPSFDQFLGIFPSFIHWWSILVGELLLAFGFIFAIYVHFSMGKRWRSGIAPVGVLEEDLKTDGIYAVSRNPMYLGVAVAQFGFFLALPSLFSLTCLLIGWLALYSQTIEEEKHLRQTFNSEYRAYASNVRRWL